MTTEPIPKINCPHCGKQAILISWYTVRRIEAVSAILDCEGTASVALRLIAEQAVTQRVPGYYCNRCQQRVATTPEEVEALLKRD